MTTPPPMQPDLVERLHRVAEDAYLTIPQWAVIDEVKAEIERLRAEVIDWCEEALIAGGRLETTGEHEGWISTNALRSVMGAGDRLVELGVYEKHPDGTGRVWWYRRKQETQESSQ